MALRPTRDRTTTAAHSLTTNQHFGLPVCTTLRATTDISSSVLPHQINLRTPQRPPRELACPRRPPTRRPAWLRQPAGARCQRRRRLAGGELAVNDGRQVRPVARSSTRRAFSAAYQHRQQLMQRLTEVDSLWADWRGGGQAALQASWYRSCCM